jgi:hypothetical protein
VGRRPHSRSRSGCLNRTRPSRGPGYGRERGAFDGSEGRDRGARHHQGSDRIGDRRLSTRRRRWAVRPDLRARGSARSRPVQMGSTSRRGHRGSLLFGSPDERWAEPTPVQPGEVDAFAAYCPELDSCYFLPYEAFPHRNQIQLRLSRSRNNQKLRINWAKEFEFGATLARVPGAIAQLGERCHGMAEVAGSIPAGSIESARMSGRWVFD